MVGGCEFIVHTIKFSHFEPPNWYQNSTTFLDPLRKDILANFGLRSGSIWGSAFGFKKSQFQGGPGPLCIGLREPCFPPRGLESGADSLCLVIYIYIYINYFVILCSWMGSQIKLDNKYMGETYFQKSGTIFFDMSSASGYTGATYFQTFGPAIFDMSSANGYVGATHFQKINPRFLA